MESAPNYDLIKEYDQELERDPESPVFVALADAYRENGLLDEALAVCQRGLKFHAKYAAAHLVLGQIYMDKGIADLAESELNLAVQLDPNNAIALAALGFVHAYTGRHESAVKYLDHAHFLSPDDAQIAKYLDEAKNAARLEAGHAGKKRATRSKESDASSTPAAKGILAERLLEEIAGMEGVDSALLMDANGRHQVTRGSGHLVDDIFGQSLASLRTGPGLPGPFDHLFIEGTEGSILASWAGEGFVAAVMPSATQPGPIALGIEQFIAREG